MSFFLSLPVYTFLWLILIVIAFFHIIYCVKSINQLTSTRHSVKGYTFSHSNLWLPGASLTDLYTCMTVAVALNS